MKRHLACISILIKDRHKTSVDIQKVLTNNGHLILARLGVNPARTCVDHCTGIISLIVEGGSSEISKLTKELDGFYGVVAKKSVLTK